MQTITALKTGLTFGALLGGIVTASVALPLPARAQTPLAAEGQVGIVACTAIAAEANALQTNDGTSTPIPATRISGIDIAFIDRAAAPVDAVTFLVTYGGKRAVAVDKGHFSPGVTIHHAFAAFAGDPYAGEKPEGCRVAQIHFEDGTI